MKRLASSLLSTEPQVSGMSHPLLVESSPPSSDPRLSALVASVRAMLAAPSKGLNGWVCLALLSSVEDVHMRLQGTLDLVSLVSGLLLCCAVPLLAAPKDGAFTSLPQDSWQKLGFLAFMTASIVFLFVSIILGMLFLNGLNTSARKVDKLTLLLHSSLFPTLIYTLFTAGCMTMAVGLGFSMQPVYGLIPSFAFSVGVTLACGVLPHLVNARFILPFSHVIHGYYKSHPQQLLAAVELALQRLEAEDEVDGTVDLLSKAQGFGASSSSSTVPGGGSSATTLKFRHLDLNRASS